jgi:hypothetical protein
METEPTATETEITYDPDELAGSLIAVDDEHPCPAPTDFAPLPLTADQAEMFTMYPLRSMSKVDYTRRGYVMINEPPIDLVSYTRDGVRTALPRAYIHMDTITEWNKRNPTRRITQRKTEARNWKEAKNANNDWISKIFNEQAQIPLEFWYRLANVRMPSLIRSNEGLSCYMEAQTNTK